MNEARSSGQLIDRDAAAALIGPLTDLVIRAGAAIMAVNRGAMQDRRQGRRIAGDGSGSRRRPHHWRGPRTAYSSGPGDIRGTRPSAKPPFDGSFFLIDPLDGTKEFVAGRAEFTVNIALVSNGTPLLGIIGAPALGLIWRGLVGRGAERLAIGDGGAIATAEPIHTRCLPPPGAPWIAAVSRSHGDARTEAFIDGRPGAVRLKLGSAVKFGRVAEGAADIYPRLAPTSEWDIAAGHAVVTAAGGKVTDAQGADVQFGRGRADFIVPEFIAWGDPSAARR